MDEDYCEENRMDPTTLWTKEPPPAPVSVVSRFRSFLLVALAAAFFFIIIIIVLGATNVQTSNRLSAAEEKLLNLDQVLQKLNVSLVKSADTVRSLEAAVENNKNQLVSGSEALKRLGELDSLRKTVTALSCSIQHLNNNQTSSSQCCPLGWTLAGSNCFFYSQQSLSWNDSRNWCDQQNSHLAILTSDEDWAFVEQRLPSNIYWVGLSDWRTGKWEWVNQTPYTMERRRWSPGQPDNWNGGRSTNTNTEDCAQIGIWKLLNDNFCSTKLRFICQMHSVRT